MREWSLGLGDPLYLTLAADMRLARPEFTNDHIWELDFGSGEPPALSLLTTYGLRARAMRIFTRFTEAGNMVSDPNEFSSPPHVRRFYPNYVKLSFAPFEGLDLIYEIYVPESNAVAGRVTITNRTLEGRELQLELCGALIPLDGHAFAHTQMQMVNVLVGQTGGLVPLLFMTGGPQPGPGPQPSLMIDLDLEPGLTRQLTWTQAATDEHQKSFDLARRIAAQPWDAEVARIELLNSGQNVEIHTSDPDWDAALAFSQNTAFSLFFPANEKLPHPSFVMAREPDQGYSPKGDGSDLPPSWAGQSPLEAYYLASLLPAASDLAKGVLQNFLSIQTEDGSIDGKPGLGGQRGNYQAMPILASLAWNIYKNTEDDIFLAEVFPGLLDFFWSWFSQSNDRDRDGIPEWQHLLQTGYDDNPSFDTWHPWAQGADITCMHNPSLLAMLIREADVLVQMAQRLNQHDKVILVHRQVEALKLTLNAAWNPRSGNYRYCDRETGQSLTKKTLARQEGPGTVMLKRTFDPPVRLLIDVQTKDPAAERPHITVWNKKNDGQTEVLSGKHFQWRSGGMVATSSQVFAKIGKIQIKGVSKKDKVVVRTVNYTGIDHTLLVPLWAGVPDSQQVQAMLKRNLLDADRFDRPFGLPAYPQTPRSKADAICMRVHLPWNQLICEGLLAYGYRKEAARLFVHLMAGVIMNLKEKHAFYQYYHAETGQGLGERNSLKGLAPVGLFLQVLGVRVYSSTRVRLEGENPFPWPITVKYKGLKILRGLDRTVVTFPDGKSVVVSDPAPCIASL